MNQYSQIIRHIKALAEADEYISTVTNKGVDETDEYISTLFPLFDVEITGASYESQSTKTFSVTMSCLSIRDFNPNGNGKKFYQNDNEIDNLNETEACLNRIWLIMNRDYSEANIVASDSPSLDMLMDEKEHILDGWSINFDVTIPNTTIRLC